MNTCMFKPICLTKVLSSLPPKIEHVERCSMNQKQQVLYDGLLSQYCNSINDESENASRQHVGIFMQFRKVANHPLLHRSMYTDEMLKDMSVCIAKVCYILVVLNFKLEQLIHRFLGYLLKYESLNMCAKQMTAKFKKATIIFKPRWDYIFRESFLVSIGIPILQTVD